MLVQTMAAGMAVATTQIESWRGRWVMWMKTQQQSPYSTWLPGRWWLFWLAVAAFLGSAGSVAAEAESSRRAREQLTLDVGLIVKPWSGDLDRMIERRLIRVLTAYSKTFYFLDKGTQHGVIHDVFRLFEEDLNQKLAKTRKPGQKHLKVRVVFIPVERDELLGALAAGKGDIAASNLTITAERQKLVDFSVPTYADVSELVVSGPASPALASAGDLAGKEVFVRTSSSYHESLLALNQRFVAEHKPPVIIREVPETLEDEDLIEMVNAGLISLTVVDRHIVDFWKRIFPAITVHEDIALRTGGSIAWAIRKGSPQLKAALDDFIARNGKGTTAGNVILARYFKSLKYVKDAASEAERQKFLDLIQYFQKYGDQYDVDWLLMAAQGYQESQLDQSVRSRVGAIGVMQVMPATGKELRVGDITQIEPNIHAGIKYMRWMIDQYYGKEPMTRLNKALFAFASYNAGAGRIAQLRKEAARRGLDPNVWFNNVEYVAAEKIGAETVTYVGNIYKYFIAYDLITKARMEKAKAAAQLQEQGR